MKLSGILEVPSLKLQAPVLQGLSDAVLNVAVGHDPSSPWPGNAGESVVEAHDVSYFSTIAALKRGDRVLWRDACHEWTYRVISSEVSTPGTLLYPPKNDKGLALVTCYPTNALFWTPDRYVVETELVSGGAAYGEASLPIVAPRLKVPAPIALVAQGLTLAQNPVLLGGLFIAGAPASSWREGPAPLEVAGDALESYFAAQKVVAAQNRAWWSDIAVAGLPMPSPWSNYERISITVDVAGATVRSVRLSSPEVTMNLVVRGDDLLIARVTVLS